MQITTPAEARTLNLKFYFTGRPCINGHLSARRTSTGKCMSCEVAWRKGISARNAVRRQEEIERRLATATVTDGLHDIVSRSAAKVAGARYYFTGAPCIRGHVSKRETCSGGCMACAKENVAKESAVEKAKARTRAYYIRNREKLLAKARNPSEQMRQRLTLNMAEWRKNNPEKAKASRRAAQARRRANGAGVIPKEMSQWVSDQKKVCHWCGAKCPQKYHVDHYEPLSKGGKHILSNLVIACPKCNLKKKAKDPYEFAATVGRLF